MPACPGACLVIPWSAASTHKHKAVAQKQSHMLTRLASHLQALLQAVAQLGLRSRLSCTVRLGARRQRRLLQSCHVICRCALLGPLRCRPHAHETICMQDLLGTSSPAAAHAARTSCTAETSQLYIDCTIYQCAAAPATAILGSAGHGCGRLQRAGCMDKGQRPHLQSRAGCSPCQF